VCAVVPGSSSSGTGTGSTGRTFRGTIREDAETGDEVLLDANLRAVDVIKGSTDGKP